MAMPTVERQHVMHHLLTTSRILIVDDSEMSRSVLRKICEHAGFKHIEAVANGVEALDAIRKRCPDLMFLDIEMPLMDGFALCDALRAEKLLGSMVIIMQTATDKPEIKARAFEVGVTDLLTKPVHPRETIARVLAHLERAMLRRESDERNRHIQEELEEAVILQNILLPREEVIDGIERDMKVDIAHYYHPASELAGDYISIRRVSQDRFAVISIDISGHGLTAALYAFSVHTLIEDAQLASHSPSYILAVLNTRLHDFMSAGKFATAFIAVIDTRHQYLDYAAAAAPPPILMRAGTPILLDTRGHLLGVDSAATYESHRLPYQSGDRLFIYSDALIESPNPQGDSMPIDEVVTILKASGTQARSAEHLKQMMDALYGNYTTKPTDDLSMMMCRL